MKGRKRTYVDKEEYERLKAEGHTDKYIAKIFGISPATMLLIKRREDF